MHIAFNFKINFDGSETISSIIFNSTSFVISGLLDEFVDAIENIVPNPDVFELFPT